jgi:hypothetical protein
MANIKNSVYTKMFRPVLRNSRFLQSSTEIWNYSNVGVYPTFQVILSLQFYPRSSIQV